MFAFQVSAVLHTVWTDPSVIEITCSNYKLLVVIIMFIISGAT